MLTTNNYTNRIGGNYPEHIQNKKLTEVELQAQLKYAFPHADNEYFEAAYICSERSQTKPTYKKLIAQLKYSYAKKASLTTLYYTYHNNAIDFESRQLAQAKLNFYDLSAEFNKYLLVPDDTEIIFSDRTNQRIASISSVIIFSDDHAEIEKIYNAIRNMTTPNPMPLLFVACSSAFNNVDTQTLPPIADFVLYDLIFSDERALDWWQSFRNNLDRLSDITHHLPVNVQSTTAETTTVKSKSHCNMM